MAKKKRRTTAARTRGRAVSRGSPNRAKEATSRRRVMLVLACGLAVVAAVVVVVFALANRPRTSAVEPTPQLALSDAPTMAPRVDGIPCNTGGISYHVHAHLQIEYEGKGLALPANIGIHDDTCLYYLHTHDESGELHIEAPAYFKFTLGEFFDIWHQPLSSTRLATLHVPPGKTLRTYLNGKVFSGNPRTIELLPHRLIALEIGPPFVRPSGFDFEGQ